MQSCMRALSRDPVELTAVLRNLIEIDADACSAYRASADRLEHPQLVRLFEAFQRDHARHERELREALRNLGEEMAPDSIREVLSSSKITMSNITAARDRDRAILRAMLVNELEINDAYELALAGQDLSPALRALVERLLDDERRHKNTLEGQLSFLAEQRAP